MIENWDINGKQYTAFIGNIGTRGSTGIDPCIPAGVFEAIEKAIRSEILEHRISWFRCFYCNISGDETFEALINNEIWEPGLNALKSLGWENKGGYYSIRNFVVLCESSA